MTGKFIFILKDVMTGKMNTIDFFVPLNTILSRIIYTETYLSGIDRKFSIEIPKIYTDGKEVIYPENMDLIDSTSVMPLYSVQNMRVNVTEYLPEECVYPLPKHKVENIEENIEEIFDILKNKEINKKFCRQHILDENCTSRAKSGVVSLFTDKIYKENILNEIVQDIIPDTLRYYQKYLKLVEKSDKLLPYEISLEEDTVKKVSGGRWGSRYIINMPVYNPMIVSGGKFKATKFLLNKAKKGKWNLFFDHDKANEIPLNYTTPMLIQRKQFRKLSGQVK